MGQQRVWGLSCMGHSSTPPQLLLSSHSALSCAPGPISIRFHFISPLLLFWVMQGQGGGEEKEVHFSWIFPR